MKRQFGYSSLELLLALLILVLIVAGGWLVFMHKYTAPRPIQEVRLDNSVLVAPWKTYRNEETGLTFQYPSTWVSKTGDRFRFADGSFGGIGGTVTSPTGHALTWVYMAAGGKGGDCVPAPSDTPFMPGNTCNSKQILKVEQLPAVKPPTRSKVRSLFDDQLYITHTKYMGAAYAEVSYQICLDSQFNDEQKPSIGTYMGLYFPCRYWSTGFNVMFQVKDEADFNSHDAVLAERIMRSFSTF